MDTLSSPHSSSIAVILARQGAWTRRFAAVALGALATLGHAPFFVVPAYMLALVGLVLLLDAAAAAPRKVARGFALGWLFGLGHFSTGMYWLASAFLVDAEAWGPLWGIPAVAAMGAGMGLFWGVGCALAAALWTFDYRRLAGFALALSISEWLRGHLFGGLPWLLPGYVWAPGGAISQLASLVGIYGLSSLTLLSLAAPAAAFDAAQGTGRRFAPLVLSALAAGLAWGWGARRLAEAPISLPGAAPIVRVADAGFTQAEKWTPRRDQEWRVLGRYLQASGGPDEGAAIVIWPEGAIPTMSFFQLDNPEFMAAIGEGMGDRVLITGLTRCEPREDCDAFMRGARDGSDLRLYNSAAVIDGVSGRARLSQVYDKHRLVPFGEFIPLWSLVSELNIAPLQRIGAGFNPGPAPTRLVVPDAPEAIVLICYEDIFPGLIPRGAERPGWIISVTNDAWFGDPRLFTGPWQHLAMSKYRAIEEGLPLARAASGGVSAIVDSFGRTVSASPTPASGAFVYAERQLPPALRPTPYVKWGFLLTPALLSLIAAARFAQVGQKFRGRGHE